MKKILDKKFISSIIFSSYRRDPELKGRGAEGASLDEIGAKLSGKRTVTYYNPGKIPGLKLGHRRG
jgi:hypothetical protein